MTILAYPMICDIYEYSNEEEVIIKVLDSATVDMQSEFATDVCESILYMNQLGYKITFGEASRTMYQQRHYVATGRSKTFNSNHLKRRALDVQIYDENGKYFSGGLPYEIMAEDFTSKRLGNVWGGSWKTFKDTPHYERRY